jgi:hypothetical protein
MDFRSARNAAISFTMRQSISDRTDCNNFRSRVPFLLDLYCPAHSFVQNRPPLFPPWSLLRNVMPQFLQETCFAANIAFLQSTQYFAARLEAMNGFPHSWHPISTRRTFLAFVLAFLQLSQTFLRRPLFVIPASLPQYLQGDP